MFTKSTFFKYRYKTIELYCQILQCRLCHSSYNGLTYSHQYIGNRGVYMTTLSINIANLSRLTSTILNILRLGLYLILQHGHYKFTLLLLVLPWAYLAHTCTVRQGACPLPRVIARPLQIPVTMVVANHAGVFYRRVEVVCIRRWWTKRHEWYVDFVTRDNYKNID